MLLLLIMVFFFFINYSLSKWHEKRFLGVKLKLKLCSKTFGDHMILDLSIKYHGNFLCMSTGIKPQKIFANSYCSVISCIISLNFL